MPNPTITNVDTGHVLIDRGETMPGEITFGGAGTLLEGTILARDSVSGKFVPFVVGGSTNENGIPKAVLTYPVVAAGAGDEAASVLVTGVVDRSRLVVDADGDSSNLTDAHVDTLRSYGIVANTVEQLAGLDNQ
jgi:hypothetical protein